MEKRRKNKTIITASVVRRFVVVLFVLLLGAGVSAAILTRPFASKQQEVIAKPINPTQTQEKHFNDIVLEDEDKKIKTDFEDYGWDYRESSNNNEEQATEGGSSDNPGGGSSDDPGTGGGGSEKQPGSITKPLFTSSVPYNNGSPVALLTQLGSSNTGIVKYCVTQNTNQPALSQFTTYSSIPTVTDIGTYYVWFYSEGDSTHLNTAIDKVGPINVVDDSIPKAQPSLITEPQKITGLFYIEGQAQDLITAGSTNDGTLKYAVVNDDSTNPTDSEYSENVPQKTNAGTYYVWYKIIGDATHYNSEASKIIVTISASSATFNVTPLASIGLIYDGTEHELISNYSLVSSSTGSVKYAVTLENEEPSKTSDVYKATCPKASDAGTYYVWYYAVGNSNSGDSSVESFSVSIGGIQTVVTAAPIANTDLTYNGSGHILVNKTNAASTSTGGFMFALTTTFVEPPKSLFTSASPIEEDAGDYYVWYYAAGDDNHSDSNIGCFPVSIAKKQVSFTGAPTDLAPEYTSSKLSIVNTDGVNSSDGQVVYYVSSTIMHGANSSFGPNGDNMGSYKDLFKETPEQKTEPGTYYVYYYAKALDANHSDYVDSSNFYIQATITGQSNLTAPIPVNTNVNDSSEYPVALLSSDGSYTGGSVYYAVTTTLEQPSLGDFATYPSFAKDSIKVSEPGTYYIWYYGKNSGNTSSVNYVVASVKQKPKFLTTPKIIGDHASESKVITDSTVVPFSNGTTEDGIIMYYLTQDTYDLPSNVPSNSLFTVSIPSVAEGAYNLYYYIKGDDKHLDGDIQIKTVDVYLQLKFVTFPKIKDSILNGTFTFDPARSAPEDSLVVTDPGTTNGGVAKYVVATKQMADMYPDKSIIIQSNLGQNNENILNPNVQFTHVDGPGEYFLFYYVFPGPENYKSTSQLYTVPFTVNKPTAQIKNNNPPTPVPGLTYQAGVAKELCTQGQADGDIKFAVTMNENEQPTEDMYSLGVPQATYPGTYYVWYYITEGPDYAASEPARIECSIGGGNEVVSFTSPTAKTDLVYNGSLQLLLDNPGSSDEGFFEYYTATLPVASGSKTSTLPRGVDAGTYYVYYDVCGNPGSFKDTFTDGLVTVTIAKANQSYTKDATFNEVLTYNGQAQSIINEDKEPVSSHNTPAEYYISQYSDAPNESTVWVPRNAATVKDPGLYYVWYRNQSTTNYNATAVRTATITVKQKAFVDTLPSPINGFEGDVGGSGVVKAQYQGEVVPLSGGTSNSGTIMYAVSKGSVSLNPQNLQYTDTIPSVKDADDYYFYYYVKSNSDLYVDSDICSIPIHVQVEKAIVTITKPVSFKEYFSKSQTKETTFYVENTGEYELEGECSEGGEIRILFSEGADVMNHMQAYMLDENYFKSIEVMDNDFFSEIHLLDGRTYDMHKVSISNAAGICIGLYYIKLNDATNYTVDPSYAFSPAALQGNMITVITIRTTNEITNEPVAATGLNDNQEYHPLLTQPATSKYGKVLYAVTEADTIVPIGSSAYSENIPQRKDAGTYYVCYYAEGKVITNPQDPKYGNSQYNPSEVSRVKVVISGGQTPSITFNTSVQVEIIEDTTPYLKETDVVASKDPSYTWHFHLGENGEGPVTDKALFEDTDTKVSLPGTYCLSYYYNDSDIHSVYIYVDEFAPNPNNVPKAKSEPLLYYPKSDPNCPQLIQAGVEDDYYSYTYGVSFSPTNIPNVGSANYSTPTFVEMAGTHYVWWYAFLKEPYLSTTNLPNTYGPVCIPVNVEKNVPNYSNGTGPEYIAGDSLTYTGLTQNVFTTNSITSSAEDTEVKFLVVKDNPGTQPNKNNFTTTVPTVKDVGEYDIYVYIQGNSNYKDSEILHFPVTVSETSPSIMNVPTIKEQEYDGTLKELVTQGSVRPEQASLFRFEYGIGTETQAPVSFSEDGYKQVNAGTYYVWWRIVGPNNKVYVEPTKVSAPAIITKANGAFDKITFISSTQATGNVINLISSLPSNLNGRQVKYCVYDLATLGSDFNVDDFSPSNNDYSFDTPYVTAPGSYVVYYYAPESVNYLEQVARHSDIISITYPEGDSEPEGIDVLYSDQEVSLVKEETGITNLGEYLYAYSLEGAEPLDNEYSNATPKAEDVGLYTIYYKLKYNNGITTTPRFFVAHIKPRASVINKEATPIDYTSIPEARFGQTTDCPSPHIILPYTGDYYNLVSQDAVSYNDGYPMYYLTNTWPFNESIFDQEYRNVGMAERFQKMYLGTNPTMKQHVIGLAIQEARSRGISASDSEIETLFMNQYGNLFFREVQVKDPGIYTVVYTAVPDPVWIGLLSSTSSYENIDPLIHEPGNNALHYFIVEIVRAKSSFTQQPTANNVSIVHNDDGSPKATALINEGVPNDSSLDVKYLVSPTQIAVSELNKNLFTTGIPTSAAAGTYYIYAYIDGTNTVTQEKAYEDSDFVEIVTTLTDSGVPIYDTRLVVNQTVTYPIASNYSNLFLGTPSATYKGETETSFMIILTDFDVQEQPEISDFPFGVMGASTVNVRTDNFPKPGKYKAWYTVKCWEEDLQTPAYAPIEYATFEIVKGKYTIADNSKPSLVTDNEHYDSNENIWIVNENMSDYLYFIEGDPLGGDNPDATMYYAFSTNSIAPSKDDQGQWFIWNTDFENNKLRKILTSNDGTYYLYYYAKPNDADCYDDSDIECLTLELHYSDLYGDPTSWTEPTFVSTASPIYTTGGPISLVTNEGEAARGWTIKYAVTKNGYVPPISQFTDELPTVESPELYSLFVVQVNDVMADTYYPADFANYPRNYTVIPGKMQFKKLPEKKENLIFTGEPLDLLVPDSWEVYKDEYGAEKGVVRFFSTADPTIEVNPSTASNYSWYIENHMGTNPGEYRVYAKIYPTTTYQYDYLESDPIFLFTVKINKQPLKYTSMFEYNDNLNISGQESVTVLTKDGSVFGPYGDFEYYISKTPSLEENPYMVGAAQYGVLAANGRNKVSQAGIYYLHFVIKARYEWSSKYDSSAYDHVDGVDGPVDGPIKIIVSGNPYFDIPLSNTLTYTGEPLELLTGEVKLYDGESFDPVEGKTLYYGFSDSENTEPDTYNVYNDYHDVVWTDATTSDYPLYLHFKSEINGTPVKNAISVGINQAPLSCDVPPTLKSGDDLLLHGINPIIVFNPGNCDYGDVYYGISNSPVTPPSNYHYYIDNASVNVPGTYFVWYYVEENSSLGGYNYCSSDPVCIGSVDVVAAPRDPSLGTLPKSVSYRINDFLDAQNSPTNEPLNAVVPGSREGYTFSYCKIDYSTETAQTIDQERVYLLEEIGKHDFSTDIPQFYPSSLYGSPENALILWKEVNNDSQELVDYGFTTLVYNPASYPGTASNMPELIVPDSVQLTTGIVDLCAIPQYDHSLGEFKFFSQPYLPSQMTEYSSSIPGACVPKDYTFSYIWVDSYGNQFGPYFVTVKTTLGPAPELYDENTSGKTITSLETDPRGRVSIGAYINNLPTCSEGGIVKYADDLNKKNFDPTNKERYSENYGGPTAQNVIDIIDSGGGTFNIYYYAEGAKNNYTYQKCCEDSEIHSVTVTLVGLPKVEIVTPPTFIDGLDSPTDFASQIFNLSDLKNADGIIDITSSIGETSNGSNLFGLLMPVGGKIQTPQGEMDVTTDNFSTLNDIIEKDGGLDAIGLKPAQINQVINMFVEMNNKSALNAMLQPQLPTANGTNFYFILYLAKGDGVNNSNSNIYMTSIFGIEDDISSPEE